MSNILKNKFNEEVFLAVEKMKKEENYIPTRFIQMLQQSENNAYEVVQRLVTKEFSSGLEKLWEKGKLELSMEAIMIKPEYKSLFSPEIIKTCEKKLKQFGYKL